MNVSNIIIIIILVLLILWVFNRTFLKTNIVYDKMLDANVPMTGASIPGNGLSLNSNNNVIFNDSLSENNTSNFMLSVWFYIDDWGNSIGNEKNILFMSNNADAKTVTELTTSSAGISKRHCPATVDTDSNNKNLNISLDSYENNLFIDLETYKTGPDQSGCYSRFIIKNIPVQKWNCLILSVDTKTFDVYLDGKLRNSFILEGTYKNKLDVGSKNIYLGYLNETNPGFGGFITRVRYEPMSINPQQAYNIYKEGINASLAKSMFNKYSLKVSFLEYNKEKGAFTL